MRSSPSGCASPRRRSPRNGSWNCWARPPREEQSKNEMWEGAMSAIKILFAAGVLLLALAAPALAQSGRTIKLVNPFRGGGPADIWARILGEQVGRERGVSVVIENRPGGGTVIATEAFSRAAPDGNN